MDVGRRGTCGSECRRCRAAESLIEAADAALYRAKGEGRNRVCAV